MSRIVTVAATQMACSWDSAANIAKAENLVRAAAAQGAQIILIQELFETPYFCQKPNPDYLQLATPTAENPAIAHFQKIARELQVVLPISFYERAGRARFNSIAILDADGSNLGVYRKSHIPDGPGYHEKYYFNPGDTGFKVWDTAYARIGVGICWDQWFPECARSMALMGAEILFYPTAIGSEQAAADLQHRAFPRRQHLFGKRREHGLAHGLNVYSIRGRSGPNTPGVQAGRWRRWRVPHPCRRHCTARRHRHCRR